jgi:putative transposase
MIKNQDAANIPGSARARLSGSAPVSGAGESVPLSRTSEEDLIQRDAETQVRDGRAPAAKEIRYTKRRLPHFEKAWTIYAVTVSTRRRRNLSPAARTIVLNALRHFHLDRYELFAACVMPDHVHFLFQPWPKGYDEPGNPIFWSISELSHSVKSFTAHRINKLERSQGAVWEEEVFDRYIRSEADLREKFRYICRNPWESGVVLSGEKYEWLWTPEDEFKKGSAPVSGAGESVPLSQVLQKKDRFGETPKPTPGTGVLPKRSMRRAP